MPVRAERASVNWGRMGFPTGLALAYKRLVARYTRAWVRNDF